MNHVLTADLHMVRGRSTDVAGRLFVVSPCTLMMSCNLFNMGMILQNVGNVLCQSFANCVPRNSGVSDEFQVVSSGGFHSEP
jgi:hypothetical protein